MSAGPAEVEGARASGTSAVGSETPPSVAAVGRATPSGSGDASWLTLSERGSLLGLRFLVFLCAAFGRRAGRLALKPVVVYFVLTHGVARRASRQFLQRLLPRVSWWLIYRHFLTFAEVALDRVFLLQGELHHFDAVSRQGFQHLRTLARRRRGAILLGAHLGSFEAMRVMAEAESLPINILVYTGNARRINALLRALSVEFSARVLEIEPGSVSSLLKLKDLVEAGQLVAMLGDRVGLNDKAAVVDFFGHAARFPTGAYLLASLLQCPVFLTFGLYTAPNRYEFFCEPFLDPPPLLSRADRGTLLQAHAQRYARRLEHYCRLAPLDWFNFYDLWT